jgi:hypothetical protein
MRVHAAIRTAASTSSSLTQSLLAASAGRAGTSKTATPASAPQKSHFPTSPLNSPPNVIDGLAATACRAD